MVLTANCEMCFAVHIACMPVHRIANLQLVRLSCIEMFPNGIFLQLLWICDTSGCEGVNWWGLYYLLCLMWPCWGSVIPSLCTRTMINIETTLRDSTHCLPSCSSVYRLSHLGSGIPACEEDHSVSADTVQVDFFSLTSVLRSMGSMRRRKGKGWLVCYWITALTH
jgi:hypothetical protein